MLFLLAACVTQQPQLGIVMRTARPNVPLNVARQWLHRHWGRSKFGWLPSAGAQFTLEVWQPTDVAALLLEMVEDCQPQHKERQQAERPTGDADNPLFIYAHLIRSRTDGSRPLDDGSDQDLFDALPLWLIPNHDPRGRFAPDRLNKWKRLTANDV